MLFRVPSFWDTGAVLLGISFLGALIKREGCFAMRAVGPFMTDRTQELRWAGSS